MLLTLAIVFLVVAVVAGLLNFLRLAATALLLARLLFVVAIVLFVVFLVLDLA
jgi:uncharacterized membrane protein YtjA (UPF0391 family)